MSGFPLQAYAPVLPFISHCWNWLSTGCGGAASGGSAANYYGLETTLNAPQPEKEFLAYACLGDLTALPSPAAAVSSRPDLHDSRGVVRRMMANADYQVAAQFQGFVI